MGSKAMGGVVVLAVGAVAVLTASRPGEAAVPEVAPAACARPAPGVPGTGTLESAQVSSPGFTVAGRMTRLLVDEGDAVKAGQLLATLDPEETQRLLAVTRANHQVSTAARERAAAELERGKAVAARTEADAQRTLALFQSRTVSALERDAVVERMESVRADLHALEAAYSQAQKAEQAAARAVSRDEQRLVELRLLSPADGVVVRKLRDVGDVVPAAAPVVTVATLHKVWVRAWVDETALPRLQPGQPARVVFRSQPGESFPGHVDRIGKQADRQTHELLVDVLVERLPSPFALGQKADVEINVRAPGVEGPPCAAAEPGTGAQRDPS